MFVLGRKWRSGYLDYYRDSDHELRIDVTDWILLSSIEDQFIVRKKEWRMVWNYLRKVGLRSVIRKIRSRIKETERNAKYVSLGIGRVLESPKECLISTGDAVLFFAYNHPKCLNHICVNKNFVTKWEGKVNDGSRNNSINYYEHVKIDIPDEMLEYYGWSPYSGQDVDENLVATTLRNLQPQIKSILDHLGKCDQYVIKSGESISEQSNNPELSERREKDGSRGVLFGLGNYAKTAVLPNLSKDIHISCIHEVDPVQIGIVGDRKTIYDTAPFPRPDEKYDVYFIAGYHHTHASIAIHALNNHAYAIVEKPIVTTNEQLKELKQTLESTKDRRLITCFHKRYANHNKWVLDDLNVGGDDPINYHCIVYEIPLPKRHWYNWRNSGSRLISNGCHWIDHFMFINRYAPVMSKDVQKFKNGDLHVSAELENGAVFTMTLTDIGSERLGVREHIELRAGEVTVCLLDGGIYRSENRSRILRQQRAKSDTFRQMYHTICEKVVAKKPGDSLESLRSSQLMLDLEQQHLSQ